MVGATGPSPPRSAKSTVIVGAGVSGLVCARALLEAGLNVVVVEAAHDLFPGNPGARFSVGLVDKYPDLAKLFSFPEYIPPVGTSPEDLRQYLLSYVEHFQLRKHIVFSCKLQHAQVDEDGRWCIVCSDLLDPQRLHRLTSDFLVLSAGACVAPSVPQLQGCADFVGCRLHARDLQAAEREGEAGGLLGGKHVLVVGDDKTAVDAARLAVQAGAHSATLLYRQPHWPLPIKLLGCATPKIAYRKCLPLVLFPPYYTAGRGSRALSSVLGPLRRLFWWRLERRLAKKYGVEEGTRPPVAILRDMFYGVQASAEEDNWVGVLQGSSIRLIRGDISRLGPDFVVLKDGSSLHANVLVHCTPSTRNYTVFDPELQASLGLRKDGLHLYRSLVPPAVPSLAFLGCETSSPFAWLTASLQAKWLAQLANGQLVLPGLRHMKADVYLQRRWRRHAFPPQHNRGSLIQWYAQAYHDQLMRDMGLEPNVKSLGRCLPFWGSCSTYTPADYRPVFAADGASSAADGIRRAGRVPWSACCSSPFSCRLLHGVDLLSAEASEVAVQGGGSASARTHAQQVPPSSTTARRALERHTSLDHRGSLDSGRRLSTEAACRAALAQVSVTSNASRLQLLLSSRTSAMAAVAGTASIDTADQDDVAAVDLMSSVLSLPAPVCPPTVGRSGLSYSSAGVTGGQSLRGSSNPGSAMSAAAVLAAAACAASSCACGSSATAGSARVSGMSASGKELLRRGASHPEIEPDGLPPPHDGGVTAAARGANADGQASGKAARPQPQLQLQPQPHPKPQLQPHPKHLKAAAVPGAGASKGGCRSAGRCSLSGGMPEEQCAGSPVRLPVEAVADMAAGPGGRLPYASVSGTAEADGSDLRYVPVPSQRVGGGAPGSLGPPALGFGVAAPASLSLLPLCAVAAGSPPGSQGLLSNANAVAVDDLWATTAFNSDMVIPSSSTALVEGDSVPAANSLSLGLPYGRAVANDSHGGFATPQLAGAVFAAARASASACARADPNCHWQSSPQPVPTANASAGGGGGGSGGGGSGARNPGPCVMASVDVFSGACSSSTAGVVQQRDISAMLPAAMLEGYEVIDVGEAASSRRRGPTAAQARSQELGGRLSSCEAPPYKSVASARFRPVDSTDDEAPAMGGYRRSLDASHPAVGAVRSGTTTAATAANAVSATASAGGGGSGGGSGLLATSYPRGNALRAAWSIISRNSTSGIRGASKHSQLHRPSQLGGRQGGAAAVSCGGPQHASLASDALADLLDGAVPWLPPGGPAGHPPSCSNSALLVLQERPSPPATAGRHRAVAAAAAASGSGPVTPAATAAAAGITVVSGVGSGSFPSSGAHRKGRRNSAVVFSNVLDNEDFMQLLMEAGNNDGRPEGVIDVCENRSMLLQGAAPSDEYAVQQQHQFHRYRLQTYIQPRGEGTDSVPSSQVQSPTSRVGWHAPAHSSRSREGSDAQAAGSSAGLRSATLRPAVQGYLSSSVVLVHDSSGAAVARGSINGAAVARGRSATGAATTTGYAASVALPVSGRRSRPRTVANGTAAAATAALAASCGRVPSRGRVGFASTAGYLSSTSAAAKGGSGLLRFGSPRWGNPRGSLGSIELPTRRATAAGHDPVLLSGAMPSTAAEALRWQHRQEEPELEQGSHVYSGVLALDTLTPMSQPEQPPQQQHQQQSTEEHPDQQQGRQQPQRPPMRPPSLQALDQHSGGGWFRAVPEQDEGTASHSHRGGQGGGDDVARGPTGHGEGARGPTGHGESASGPTGHGEGASGPTGQWTSPEQPRGLQQGWRAEEPHRSGPARSSSLLLDGSATLAASLGAALVTLNAQSPVAAAAGDGGGSQPPSKSLLVAAAAPAAGPLSLSKSMDVETAALGRPRRGAPRNATSPVAGDRSEGPAAVADVDDGAAAEPSSGAASSSKAAAASPQGGVASAGAPPQGGVASAGAPGAVAAAALMGPDRSLMGPDRSLSPVGKDLKQALSKQTLLRGWNSFKAVLGFRSGGAGGGSGSKRGNGSCSGSIAVAAAGKAATSTAAVAASLRPATGCSLADRGGPRGRGPVEERSPSLRGHRCAAPLCDTSFISHDAEEGPGSPTAAAAASAGLAAAAAAAMPKRPVMVGRSQSDCLPHDMAPGVILADGSPCLSPDGFLPYGGGSSFTVGAAAAAAARSPLAAPPPLPAARSSPNTTNIVHDFRNVSSFTRGAAAPVGGTMAPSRLNSTGSTGAATNRILGITPPSRLNSNVCAGGAGAIASRAGSGAFSDHIVDLDELPSIPCSPRAPLGTARSQQALVFSGQDSEAPAALAPAPALLPTAGSAGAGGSMGVAVLGCGGGGGVGTAGRRRLPLRQGSSLALAVDATAAVLAAAAAGPIAVPCVTVPTHTVSQGPGCVLGSAASHNSPARGGGTGGGPPPDPAPGNGSISSSTGARVLFRTSSAIYALGYAGQHPQQLGLHAWDELPAAGVPLTLHNSLRVRGSTYNTYTGMLSPAQQQQQQKQQPQQQQAGVKQGRRSHSVQGLSYPEGGSRSADGSPHDSGSPPFVADSLEASAGHERGGSGAGPGARTGTASAASPGPRATPRRLQNLLRTLLGSTNSFVAGTTTAATAASGSGSGSGGGGGEGSNGSNAPGGVSTNVGTPGGPLSPTAGRRPVRRPPKRVFSEHPQMLGGQQRRLPFGRSGSPPASCVSPPAARDMAAAACRRGSIEVGRAINSPTTPAFSGGGGGGGRTRRLLLRRDSVIENLLAEMAEDGSLLEPSGMQMQHNSGVSAAVNSVAGCPSAMAAAGVVALGAGFDPHAPEGVLSWERPPAWGEATSDGAGGGEDANSGERRTFTRDRPPLHLAAAAAAGLPSVILGHVPPQLQQSPI